MPQASGLARVALASLAGWGWMHMDILWEGTPPVLGMEHTGVHLKPSWASCCFPNLYYYALMIQVKGVSS